MKILTVYTLNSHLLTLKAHSHKMYVFCRPLKYLKPHRQTVWTLLEQSDLGPQCLPRGHFQRQLFCWQTTSADDIFQMHFSWCFKGKIEKPPKHLDLPQYVSLLIWTNFDAANIIKVVYIELQTLATLLTVHPLHSHILEDIT